MIAYLKVYGTFVQNLLKTKKFQDLIQRPIKLNYNFHVPYLCGYSRDGKTVYIDKDLKRYFKYKGKTYDAVDFLLVHEYVEWVLIQYYGIEYKKAHHITTHVEYLALHRAGVSWTVYTKFLKPQIKTAYHASIKNLPRDLDLRPYEDEHERKILAAFTGQRDPIKPMEKLRRKKKSVSYKKISIRNRKPVDNREENDYDNDRTIHGGWMQPLRGSQKVA